MENITLKNMPLGKLYEFDDDYYVWKISRIGGTREQKYLFENNHTIEYMEVFLLDNKLLKCEFSGNYSFDQTFLNDRGLDSDNCFFIFSYDEDCGMEFEQKKDLKEAPITLQKQVLEQERSIIKSINSKLEKIKKINNILMK